MEDKTPIYLLCIVGIVAVVAVIYMFSGQSTASDTNTGAGSSITGNIVSDVNNEAAPVDLSGLGRFLVGVVLIGSCLYMYRKWE